MEWALVPISARLWRLGGKKNKAYRRFGIPLVFFLLAWMLDGFAWKYVLMAVLAHFAFRIPFTLIGDDLHQHEANWLWVPIWAILHVAPTLFFTLSWTQLTAVGIMVACAVLSNLPLTRYIFKWDRCEYVFGTCVAIPFVI